MAIFSDAELTEVRRYLASNGTSVNYDKATVNAAAEAVRTFLATAQPDVVAAINTATAPVVLSGAQKTLVFLAVVIKIAARRGL